jgi:hypothetical protein
MWDWIDGEVVGEEVAWARGPVPGLPALSALLAGSRVTPLMVDGRPHELVTGGGWAWLCEPPGGAEIEVVPAHREFWAVCGGIVESHGMGGWLLNQDEVLTAGLAGGDVTGLLADYEWLWSDAGLPVPIDPADYYPAAIEANGNHTLVHRRTGQVLLFAPDHDFDGVRPLPGCPENSLLTIDGLPDLRSWLEALAG